MCIRDRRHRQTNKHTFSTFSRKYDNCGDCFSDDSQKMIMMFEVVIAMIITVLMIKITIDDLCGDDGYDITIKTMMMMTNTVQARLR